MISHPLLSGNGHQLVRHRQHIAGSGYDEVLEGKAHHLEEAGETEFQRGFRIAQFTRYLLKLICLTDS